MPSRLESARKKTAEANVPPPIAASAVRTVRFQEVDMMGVVWHGRYVDYLEEGRCALGKAFGLDYSDFFREGLKAPVVSLEIEYKIPLFLGETFRVEAQMLWTEAVRLNYEYTLRRELDGQVVARAKTVQLLLDMENRLLLVWPEYFQRIRSRWKAGTLRGVHA
jgi:acyl-CoA thioester hydrolase